MDSHSIVAAASRASGTPYPLSRLPVQSCRSKLANNVGIKINLLPEGASAAAFHSQVRTITW